MLDVGQLSNNDYEERLIAMLMAKPEAILELDITEEDFYGERNRIYYGTILEMVSKRIPVSVPSVIQQMKLKHGDLIDMSLVGVCTKELDFVPKFADEYVKAIKGYSRARQAYAMYRKSAVELFRTQPEEVDAVINSTGQELMKLTMDTAKDELSEVDTDTMLTATEELLGSVTTGLQTGWKSVNKVLRAGFNNGDLAVLAGRPSMGKTAMALNLATHLIKQGHHVLFFSLETNKVQVVKRIIQAEACVERKTEGVTGEEASRLRSAADVIQKVKDNLFICDQCGMTPEQIAVSARKNKFQYGDISLIIVDHLQLMRAKGFHPDDRHGIIGHCTSSFKGLAKELQCPVLALSQLNRGVESREDKRPRLSDLKESGSIEQDADLVLMLYRNYPYTKKDEDRFTAELIVAKQKEGATGDVHMMYLPQFMLFQDEPAEWQAGLEMGEEVKGELPK